MPFHSEARIEVWNESALPVTHFFYYADYELHDRPDWELGTFHAAFARENPTDGIDATGLTNHAFQMDGVNPTGSGNYDVLRAEGEGHYVGCVLSIQNLRHTHEHNWYGEGDDMIFIDGDAAPTLHGTGTEDYFNTAWCPAEAHQAPYHGIIMPGGPNYSGRVCLYRFHVEDPVIFRRSIRVSIEHGHANRRSDDWSSVAGEPMPRRARRHWLFKTEPESFSIADLAASPGQTTAWDGVRNYQARNFLRDEVKEGDEVLIHHSNAAPPAIVGTATVVGRARPDLSALDPDDEHHDPRSTREEPIWYLVDLKLKRRFARPLGLPLLKSVRGLRSMLLLQKGSRLSIQPVTDAEWKLILELAANRRDDARTTDARG
jgi:predicted RNA-binding protein with PUA-like domain